MFLVLIFPVSGLLAGLVDGPGWCSSEGDISDCTVVVFESSSNSTVIHAMGEG